MKFFLTPSSKVKQLTAKTSLFKWCFSLLIVSLLSLTFVYALVFTSSTRAADHAHSSSLSSIPQQLRSVVRVTHVGHVKTNTNAASTLPAYNTIGISDNANPASANFDGNGNSYSSQDFINAGWNPGDVLAYQGFNYVWPAVQPGQSDNYVNNGQTIPVTPVAGAVTIGFVGSADHASSGFSGTATLNYTDGSSKSFTLSMSDWTLSKGTVFPLINNYYFAGLIHVNNSQGQKNEISYLFEQEIPLTAGKTLQSVTLPQTSKKGHLHIFTIATRANNNFMNNVGVTNDGQPLFANYDGNRDNYSNQTLEADNIYVGQPFLFNGVSFPLTASYTVIPDNYQAAGQTILPVAVSNATTMAFIGSATNTNSSAISSGTAIITYTDGSTQTFTLSLTDWGNATALSNNLIAATFPYIDTSTGTRTGTYHLYYTDVALQAGKTVQSVTLPSKVSSGELHIFSVGLK